MWTSQHVGESLKRNNVSNTNNYLQYKNEIIGEGSADFPHLLTDAFVYEEIHDIKIAERFVGWTYIHSRENLGFALGNYHHIKKDIISHSDPIFQRFVNGFGTIIAENGPALDHKFAKVIAHLAVECNVALKDLRKNPKIAEIAHEEMKDIDMYSPLIGEFYQKDTDRLREQLSVTRDFKVEFYCDPVCFAKTLLDNYKRIGKVKDERVNRFFDYLSDREDCLEQDIRTILTEVDKYLSYKSFYSFFLSPRQVIGSPLFSPFRNYRKKLQI
jgi:hypothetical protein